METVIRSETSIRFGNFELDLRTRELYRNGFRLKVRGHPVDVLAILLEHPGELVTREELQKAVDAAGSPASAVEKELRGGRR